VLIVLKSDKKKSTVRYVTRKMKGDICNAKKSASDNFFIIAVLATTLLPNSGMYAKAELVKKKKHWRLSLGK